MSRMAADVEQDKPEIVEVFATKNRGRGVRVTSDVKAGTVLLTEKPFEFVLQNKERGFYCDQCLTKREEILQKCSACKFAFYCNKECQRAAWASHKLECEGINRVSPNVPSDHIRLMARLCRKRKKQQAPALNGASTFPSHIDQLQSVPTDLRGDTQLEFSSWLYTLRRFMGDGEASNLLPAEVLELFGRMRCNTCDVSDGELHSIAIGLYLKFSMFNHSCDYNCIAIHTGSTMNVRAVKDIPGNKEFLPLLHALLRADDPPGFWGIHLGKQCFLSYVDIQKPTATRNAILRNVFQFTCKCPTCRDTSRDQLRHSVRCGNLDCKDPVLLNPDGTVKKCNLCNFESFSSDYSERLKMVEQQCTAKLSAAEEIINFGNWPKILDLSEQCLVLQRGILHPYHHLVLETLHYAMDACIHLEKWEQALEYGLRSVQQLDFHSPGNNATGAIQFMRVGKLQQYLKMNAEAMKNLQKAENILHITHGTDHPLCVELKDMIMACTLERRYTKLESIEEAEPYDEQESEKINTRRSEEMYQSQKPCQDEELIKSQGKAQGQKPQKPNKPPELCKQLEPSKQVSQMPPAKES